MNLLSLAQHIDQAALHGNSVPQLTHTQAFSVDEAYDIQAASLNERYSRGETFVGLKLGFTSRAKRVQMGVDDLIWGRLTDAMQYTDGGTFSMEGKVHPRIEPEVAFILKKDIDRPIGMGEAGAYLEAVAPALEIIDSRYQNFKFSLADVVADNCSSTGFVLGGFQSPHTDVENLGILFHINDKLVHTGSTAAILGNPLRAIPEISRLCVAAEQALPAGSIVLAGAATAAVHLQSGDFVSLEMEKLGTVSLHIS